MEKQIEQLQSIIDSSKHVVFFTGAGVSTESNIPDFRSADGLYNQSYKYPPEQIISHSFFMNDPKEFYRFYKDRMLYLDAKPNQAHIFMAKLENEGRCDGVITQNIDGLHTLAGSKNVIELHGSVLRNYCMQCGKFYGVESIVNAVDVPHCDCGGIIKPDVVLYEEALDENNIKKAISLIENADCLIICGTSLQVYPAASFVRYYRGNNLVLINRDATPYDDNANLCIHDSLKNVFPKITI